MQSLFKTPPIKTVRSKLGGLRKNEFIKVSSWSAFATFFKMLSSFISIKIASKIIGPEGIALVGQFLNSTTIISTLGTGCINQGITKYVAEFSNQNEKQEKIISNSLRITFLTSLLVTLLVLIFYRQLGYYIFKSNSYNYVIFLFGLSIILFSMNLTLVSIINGFKSYRKFVYVNISSSVFTLLITVPIVYFFGLSGALINTILSQALIIFITIFFIKKEPWFLSLSLRWERLDKTVLKMLGGFAMMAIVSAVLGPYAQLFIRGYIIDHLSLNAAGLWEGMNRLSSMYLMLITSSIAIYYLPRLSEIKEPLLLKQEIWKTTRMVLPALAAFCLFVFLFKDAIIRIVFTQEFGLMRNLFAIQLIGDFFKIASFLIANLFWAKARIKSFIILEVIFTVNFALLTCLFIHFFGFEGTVMGYALNFFLYWIAVLLIFRKVIF
jgi:PST family polysaccharide transporter